ncbi:MAG: thiamine pyrophosphate-dependent dehydrogenase E1 component subunit alpha [Elusimicrobia bacterium]|nr:thiamine pyrophosphate-dependent dehydrogenase E1 component subunit alpha [Candidatus Liberimonas magnetica]
MKEFISKNKTVAIELLYKMKNIRLVEETIARRYSEWKMRCPTHLCTGQESVAVAVGTALRKDDFVISTHRAHGHYLGKGGSLKRMIAEIYGKSTGCSKGKGGSMHLIDKSVNFMGSTAIVGGTIPVGVGLGLSITLKKTDQISCVFFGDGSIEEGVFYESVNFAVLKKLPVLFICENNFYSVYSPLKVRQPEGRKIYEMVAAMGCPSQCGNGNDVLEVYQKVNSVLEGIRQGNGPFFFEFDTYRWREHCGHNFDNDLGYRTQEEYLSWKEKDPVCAWETILLEAGVISTKDIEEMENKINKEIANAFDFAEKSPFPDTKEVCTEIYSE